jgi:chemotaxis protein MotA
VVIGSVLGGYMWHGGEPLALNQPNEVLIIGGAALGALLISTPFRVIKGIISQVMGVLKGSYGGQDYLDVLVMMFEIFNIARRDGLVGLENHIEHPEESGIFQRYPRFQGSHEAMAFFCDTMRVIISGAVQPHDLEDMMDNDIDALHEEEMQPGDALSNTADSLPGLGIVITMAQLDGPPELIGQNVAAALVGTFLGILACYGFVGPLAASMKSRVNENTQYIRCMKHALLAFNKGVAGVIAVEFARRALTNDVRPSFTELEDACNEAKKK